MPSTVPNRIVLDRHYYIPTGILCVCGWIFLLCFHFYCLKPLVTEMHKHRVFEYYGDMLDYLHNGHKYYNWTTLHPEFHDHD